METNLKRESSFQTKKKGKGKKEKKSEASLHTEIFPSLSRKVVRKVGIFSPDRPSGERLARVIGTSGVFTGSSPPFELFLHPLPQFDGFSRDFTARPSSFTTSLLDFISRRLVVARR